MIFMVKLGDELSDSCRSTQRRLEVLGAERNMSQEAANVSKHLRGSFTLDNITLVGVW